MPSEKLTRLVLHQLHQLQRQGMQTDERTLALQFISSVHNALSESGQGADKGVIKTQFILDVDQVLSKLGEVADQSVAEVVASIQKTIRIVLNNNNENSEKNNENVNNDNKGELVRPRLTGSTRERSKYRQSTDLGYSSDVGEYTNASKMRPSSMVSLVWNADEEGNAALRRRRFQRRVHLFDVINNNHNQFKIVSIKNNIITENDIDNNEDEAKRDNFGHKDYDGLKEDKCIKKDENNNNNNNDNVTQNMSKNENSSNLSNSTYDTSKNDNGRSDNDNITNDNCNDNCSNNDNSSNSDISSENDDFNEHCDADSDQGQRDELDSDPFTSHHTDAPIHEDDGETQHPPNNEGDSLKTRRRLTRQHSTNNEGGRDKRGESLSETEQNEENVGNKSKRMSNRDRFSTSWNSRFSHIKNAFDESNDDFLPLPVTKPNERGRQRGREGKRGVVRSKSVHAVKFGDNEDKDNNEDNNRRNKVDNKKERGNRNSGNNDNYLVSKAPERDLNQPILQRATTMDENFSKNLVKSGENPNNSQNKQSVEEGISGRVGEQRSKSSGRDSVDYKQYLEMVERFRELNPKVYSRPLQKFPLNPPANAQTNRILSKKTNNNATNNNNNITRTNHRRPQEIITRTEPEGKPREEEIEGVSKVIISTREVSLLRPEPKRSLEQKHSLDTRSSLTAMSSKSLSPAKSTDKDEQDYEEYLKGITKVRVGNQLSRARTQQLRLANMYEQERRRQQELEDEEQRLQQRIEDHQEDQIQVPHVAELVPEHHDEAGQVGSKGLKILEERVRIEQLQLQRLEEDRNKQERERAEIEKLEQDRLEHIRSELRHLDHERLSLEQSVRREQGRLEQERRMQEQLQNEANVEYNKRRLNMQAENFRQNNNLVVENEIEQRVHYERLQQQEQLRAEHRRREAGIRAARMQLLKQEEELIRRQEELLADVEYEHGKLAQQEELIRCRQEERLAEVQREQALLERQSSVVQMLQHQLLVERDRQDRLRREQRELRQQEEAIRRRQQEISKELDCLDEEQEPIRQGQIYRENSSLVPPKIDSGTHNEHFYSDDPHHCGSEHEYNRRAHFSGGSQYSNENWYRSEPDYNRQNHFGSGFKYNSEPDYNRDHRYNSQFHEDQGHFNEETQYMGDHQDNNQLIQCGGEPRHYHEHQYLNQQGNSGEAQYLNQYQYGGEAQYKSDSQYRDQYSEPSYLGKKEGHFKRDHYDDHLLPKNALLSPNGDGQVQRRSSNELVPDLEPVNALGLEKSNDHLAEMDLDNVFRVQAVTKETSMFPSKSHTWTPYSKPVLTSPESVAPSSSQMTTPSASVASSGPNTPVASLALHALEANVKKERRTDSIVAIRGDDTPHWSDSSNTSAEDIAKTKHSKNKSSNKGNSKMLGGPGSAFKPYASTENLVISPISPDMSSLKEDHLSLINQESHEDAARMEEKPTTVAPFSNTDTESEMRECLINDSDHLALAKMAEMYYDDLGSSTVYSTPVFSPPNIVHTPIRGPIQKPVANKESRHASHSRPRSEALRTAPLWVRAGDEGEDGVVNRGASAQIKRMQEKYLGNIDNQRHSEPRTTPRTSTIINTNVNNESDNNKASSLHLEEQLAMANLTSLANELKDLERTTATLRAKSLDLEHNQQIVEVTKQDFVASRAKEFSNRSSASSNNDTNSVLSENKESKKVREEKKRVEKSTDNKENGGEREKSVESRRASRSPRIKKWSMEHNKLKMAKDNKDGNEESNKMGESNQLPVVSSETVRKATKLFEARMQTMRPRQSPITVRVPRRSKSIGSHLSSRMRGFVDNNKGNNKEHHNPNKRVRSKRDTWVKASKQHRSRSRNSAEKSLFELRASKSCESLAVRQKAMLFDQDQKRGNEEQKLEDLIDIGNSVVSDKVQMFNNPEVETVDEERLRLRAEEIRKEIEEAKANNETNVKDDDVEPIMTKKMVRVSKKFPDNNLRINENSSNIRSILKQSATVEEPLEENWPSIRSKIDNYESNKNKKKRRKRLVHKDENGVNIYAQSATDASADEANRDEFDANKLSVNTNNNLAKSKSFAGGQFECRMAMEEVESKQAMVMAFFQAPNKTSPTHVLNDEPYKEENNYVDDYNDFDDNDYPYYDDDDEVTLHEDDHEDDHEEVDALFEQLLHQT